MRSILRPAQLILLGAVLVTPVFADDVGINLARLAWVPLFDKTPSGVSLQYRIMDTPTGYAVAFKNTGTQAIQVQVTTPGHPLAAFCPVKLLKVSLGEGGQGQFWLDEED